MNAYRVRIHVQELTENIIDRSHFYQVHDMVPPDDDHFEVAFDGHSMIVDQSIKVTAVADAGFEVQTRTTTCGPGIVAVEVREGPLDMLTFITQTPLESEMVEVTISFSMKALDDEQATESVSLLNAEVTNLQFTQDIPIFEHKIYRDRPMLTKADGPVAQLPALVPALLLGLGSRTRRHGRELRERDRRAATAGRRPPGGLGTWRDYGWA